MSLISYRKKFIFFHLYKCGGNSLRQVLNKVDTHSIEWGGVHGLPDDVRTHYLREDKLNVFDDFYIFTFIRNPYDFMVSTYFYGKSNPNHFMHNDILNNNMTMTEFIPYYMKIRENHLSSSIRPFGSNKVVTIKDWLHDNNGNEIMDYVGKLETMQSDVKKIFKTLNLPLSQVPVVNVNGNRDKNYRKYYNGTSKNMIDQYFAWELEKFKYLF